MPFQAAEVIAGIVALPASVRLRHSYSIQPGSKSPIASRFCAIARWPSAWSCFSPSARSRQAIARSRSSTSTKTSDRLTRCSGLFGSSRIDSWPVGHRLLHPVGRAAQRTEMRVPGGVAWPKLDRPAQQRHALFRITCHGCHDALQRQCCRMIGRSRQDIGADPARLIQPLRLRCGLRPRQRLLDRFSACKLGGGGLVRGNRAGRRRLASGWGASQLLDRCVSTHIADKMPREPGPGKMFRNHTREKPHRQSASPARRKAVEASG